MLPISVFSGLRLSAQKPKEEALEWQLLKTIDAEKITGLLVER